MKDLQKMMREAQKMAAEMQQAQQEVAESEFEGSAGGGAVTVRATGDQRVLSINIDSGFFDGSPDEDDMEILADTVKAAVNDALAKARDAQQEALGPIAGGMGGMGLPGM